MTDLQDYIDTNFSPLLEYKCNDASGGLVNSGSAGAAYDLDVAGNPTFQAGTGETFGSTASDYYVDLDGTGDTFHQNAVSALTAEAEGAIVFIIRKDVPASQEELFILKPEVGVSAFMQIVLNSTNRSLRQNINDGAGNKRELDIGNANWNPMISDDNTVHHFLVSQYSTADGHSMWVDGVRVDDVPGSLKVLTETGSGSTMWWSALSGLVEVISIGGRAEYNGLGSFVSTAVEFDGRIEYAGFFATAFTDVQIDEMWKRFRGGVEIATSITTTTARYPRRNARSTAVDGGPAGIDLITHLALPTYNNTGAQPHGYWLERTNQVWTNRVQGSGYCQRWIDSSSGDMNQNINQFRITKEGWTVCLPTGAVTRTSHPMYVLGTGGKWVRDTAGTGSSEAFYNQHEITGTASATGLNESIVGVIGSAFGENFPVWYWDGTNWTRKIGWLDTPPTREAPGNRFRSLHTSVNEDYWACATQSTSGDVVSTGGGAVHIYSISGTGATLAGVRQTISGYTPTNVDARGVYFFNDGTTDYVVFLSEAGATLGATGELDGVTIFKRSGSTWTATANLFNNGVSPKPTGATYVGDLAIFGDDMYLGYWNGTSGSGMTGNNMLHLRWNGTYFAKQTDPEWPYITAEDPDVIGTATAFDITSDGKGLVVGTAGAKPVDMSTDILFYDRDTTTGALTWRGDVEWDNASPVIAAEMELMGAPEFTEMKWTDHPNGRA